MNTCTKWKDEGKTSYKNLVRLTNGATIFLKLKKVIKFYKEFYKHKIIEFHKEEATLKNGLKIAHIEFQEIKHDNE
jgi:hypothetical protein